MLQMEVPYFWKYLSSYVTRCRISRGVTSVPKTNRSSRFDRIQACDRRTDRHRASCIRCICISQQKPVSVKSYTVTNTRDNTKVLARQKLRFGTTFCYQTKPYMQKIQMEGVFTARRSYASAVLGVVIMSVCPSVCPSVCHTCAL